MRVWDVKTHKLTHTFDQHRGVVTSVEFHPSGRHVLSACADGVVRVWDAKVE